jgi:hypothetical protein
VARSFGELKQHINAYLRNPRLETEQRALVAAQECGPQDGRAAERISQTLHRLASASSYAAEAGIKAAN